MRKILVMLALILVPFSVGAVEDTCSNEEIANLRVDAGQIKINYVEKERVLEPGTYFPPDGLTQEELDNYVEIEYYFDVTVLNLNEKFMIEIKNSANDEVIDISPSDIDEDGKFTFVWNDLDEVATFTATVKMSGNTSCLGEPLRNIYLSVPRYNPYHSNSACESFPDEPMCQKYVTMAAFDGNTFYEKIDKLQNPSDEEKGNDDETVIESVYNFFTDNLMIIIIVGIIIIASGVAAIVVIRKRRSKL